MAPLLIDKRGLLKLSFLSALTSVILFSGGFLFGYEKASSKQLEESVVEVLDLPAPVIVANQVEQQIPTAKLAGEDIDVDSPELIVTQNIKDVAVASKKKITDLSGKDSKNVTSVDNEKHPAKIKQDIVAITNNQKAKVKEKNHIESDTPSIETKTIVLLTEKVLISSLTKDELNDINYSIQVGMYGRLVNAENMMKMLQAKSFDAYVSDYLNNKNEVRYNVRLGYFKDKKTAITALKNYKKTEKSDGYLVKFNADNIVNTVVASKLVPASNDEVINPDSSQHDTVLDKVSQADILQSSQIDKKTATN